MAFKDYLIKQEPIEPIYTTTYTHTYSYLDYLKFKINKLDLPQPELQKIQESFNRLAQE